jgi:hypothetical protein
MTKGGGKRGELRRELQAAHNPAQRSGVFFQLKIGYGMRKAEVTG